MHFWTPEMKIFFGGPPRGGEALSAVGRPPRGGEALSAVYFQGVTKRLSYLFLARSPRPLSPGETRLQAQQISLPPL